MIRMMESWKEKTWTGIGTSILIAVVSVVACWQWQYNKSTEAVFQAAQKAYQRAPRTSLRLTGHLLARDPRLIEVRLLSARSHVRLQEFRKAIADFELIPDDGAAIAITARIESGDVFLQELRQLTAAEKQYRRALAHGPNNTEALEKLAFVLGLTSRSVEAERIRIALLAHGEPNPMWLWLLALGADAVENESQLAAYHEVIPDDPTLLVAAARIAIEHQRMDVAERHLDTVLRRHPDHAGALVWQGKLWLDQQRFDKAAQWESRIGDLETQSASIWSVRGFLAQHRTQPRIAIRCFAEAILLDPNRPDANYQLGQLLTQDGSLESAGPFLERARRLQDYVSTVKLARSGSDVAAMDRAALQAEELGFLWEAEAWWKLILQKDHSLKRAVEAISRLKKPLSELGLQRTLPSANPARTLDFNTYPLPDRPRESTIVPTTQTLAASRTSRIHFEDRAAAANLHFQFYNGAELGELGPRMFEFTGGGVAVLDFDGDGWPDVYFAQGRKQFAVPTPSIDVAEQLNSEFDAAKSDRIFRNRGDLTFEDVTELAGLRETSFSQGVTIGDFDNDGFPDLLVANIGLNRLFHNKGDGTFEDVSIPAGICGNSWTTSCVMADLNGDSLPDIYAVNYLEGSDLFDRVCKIGSGKSHSCLPQQFQAAEDQLLINMGNGRFADVTAVSGIVAPDGKGLGVVVADFVGDGRLSLFVANDTTANFFFRLMNSPNDKSPRFQEDALIRGLAFGGEGRAQASMGIACGDTDGNGLVDLFVTNFYDEWNTLYRQQAGGWFVDATRQSRLSEPSYKMLGFGTQFLDADLDGNLDLAVSNGHVDDYSERGVPYQMRPQFLQNESGGRFRELTAKDLGPYFSRPCLGRALATLDANRDGRPDIIVTHLDKPAALLVNMTQSAGNSLRLSLHAVTTARDAIGTTVTATIAGGKIVRQLTAGDGYLASNERKLVIGVGDADFVEVLDIRWPSGVTTTFYDVPSNHDITVIERQSIFIPRSVAP